MKASNGRWHNHLTWAITPLLVWGDFQQAQRRDSVVALGRQRSVELHKLHYSTLLLATNPFLIAQLPQILPPIPSATCNPTLPLCTEGSVSWLWFVISISNEHLHAPRKSPLNTPAPFFLHLSLSSPPATYEEISATSFVYIQLLPLFFISLPPTCILHFSGPPLILVVFCALSLLNDSNRCRWLSSCSEAHFCWKD